MGKVKFQPASGKGYSNIPNAQFMIAQLEKKLEKDEREEEKALENLEARDRKAEAKLLEIDRTEEANLKQINMEDSIHSVKLGAMQNNMNQEVRNFQAEKAGILAKTGLEEVLEFAPSFLESAKKKVDKDWEATMEGSYNYHMTHGLTEDQKIRLELIEDANYVEGEGFELIADNMQADGYQPKEVQWVRLKNKAADYGRLKAYANLALKDLVPTAKQQMIERGITSAAAQKAFMRDFEIEYLKAHNLYDPTKQKAISADFMSEGLETVAEQKRVLFNRTENIEAFNAADERKKGELLVVQNNLNSKVIDFKLAGESINNLYKSHLRSWDRSTGDVMTPAQARDAVITDLQDINKFPNDAHVEAALRAAQGKDNFYTQAIPLLMQKRAAARKKAEETKVAAEDARFESDMKQADKFFNPTEEDINNKTGWNGSQKAANNAIDYLIQRYPKRIQDIQDKYGKYTDWTPAGRLDGDWSTGHYNDKYDNARFTYDDFNAEDLPPEFKNVKFRQEVARRDKIITQANYDDRWKKGIENALTNALVEDDMKRGGKIDESFEGAAYHAETRFRQCVIGPGGDAESCAKAITAEIETKTGDFTVGYYGKGKNRRAGSFFEKFSATAAGPAKLAINDFTTLNGEEADEAVNQVESENHMIHNRLYLKPKQLEEIHNAIANGHPFRYPRILKRIADLNPEYFGSQYDVFRSQVEVAKRMGLLDKQFDKETGEQTRGALNMHTFMKAWHRQTNDPNAQKFIKSLSTLDDARKGITLAWRPESKAEPQFMSETVAENVTVQPVDPALLVDPNAPEYQFNPGIISEINKMIAVSKGAVNKDEILYDGNFIRTNGNTTEYFKLKGEENGYRYAPGQGWYKSFYEFNIR